MKTLTEGSSAKALESELEDGCACGKYAGEDDERQLHAHPDDCGCAHHDHAPGHEEVKTSEHEAEEDGCGCAHCDHDHGNLELSKGSLISAGVGAAVFAVGVAISYGLISVQMNIFGWIELPLFLLAYLLIGGGVLLTAGKNILKGKVFDENFLMTIATIGAFAIGEFPEGVAVMLFYRVGEAFQDYAVGKSRKSITELMDIRPDYANLKRADGEIVKVDPEEVKIGDVIVVKPGEKIPLDGMVVTGASAIDTSALTGESVPAEVSRGSDVLSGSISMSGLIEIEVKKIFAESTVSKILALVERASDRKAKIENFISKFAKVYTPAVVFAAAALALIPPLVISGAVFAEWIGRALVFLVVSCPCALVISIPLSYFAGIGASSRKGILVKGAAYMDALSDVDTAVFDKTGTLTFGKFRVSRIVPDIDISEEELLRLAAFAESGSNHPVALSVTERYGKPIDYTLVSNVKEIVGEGVTAKVDGQLVACGNASLMKTVGTGMAKEGSQTESASGLRLGNTHDSWASSAQTDPWTAVAKSADGGMVIHVAIDGVYAGRLEASDEVKPDSKNAIADLKKLGVRKTLMFTGDRIDVAKRIGEEIGIDEENANMLPSDKFEKIEEVFNERDRAGRKGSIIFAGDGINDAPVLARADVGIAMGGIGSDAAIEAADVVVMTDEPSKVAAAIRIAKKTKSIVMQNIVFALSVKGVILLLGALGIANMWMAVFGDVGVALIAILNSLRAMRE
ncbi:MAG: cadmium-translocating P-type ATPase [Clostridiales Family XIII bacterium]|nr:cadmium-translocating P-type ATPase [Clostridiales Family XIII bacterium]